MKMRVRGPKSGFRKTIPLRRDLRHNTTFAEQIFWPRVAGQQFAGLKFRRQHGIGNSIVDFYCPGKKLIVEIDGDTHAERQIQQEDKERTAYLESLGYTVIRYNNRDIMNNVDGVFEDLTNKLNQL